MFRNLVRNAVDHTGAGEPIILSARADNGQHRVLPWPTTGTGIPAASLARIFDRFYRTDEARDRDHGGSGLGYRSPARSWRRTAGGSGPSRPRRAGRRIRFELPHYRTSPADGA